MGFAVFAFFVVFLLIASGALLVFYRDAMLQRLPRVLSPHSEGRAPTVLDRFKDPAASLGALVEPFEKVLPRSTQEVSVVQKRLIMAGYREERATKIFYGVKALFPLALCCLVILTPIHSYGVLAYLMALGLGYLIPDFWLSNRMKARQLAIRLGLPDVLDLLIVCIEAGLSMDQAMIRTAEELSAGQPAISDELGLVVLEQRAGRPRADAWKNLAERTGLDVMRELVAVLIQADQFGTSVAKNLRIYSETLRTRRRQQLEEQAAKTSVKLVFPLVLFIFPSLFVVTLGPSLISMADTFKRLGK